MDISSSLAPRSDQLNADDLISGPITVTIAEVVEGKAEQPFDFKLVEYPGRAYRPSLSMRRMIVRAWGAESSKYAGRRLTLFRNPEITFGKDKVGGIQISHMSDIAEPVTLPLTVTRGKRTPFTIQPLTTAPTGVDQILAAEWISTIREATTTAQLQAAWSGADKAGVTKDPKVLAAKETRKRELA